jgi:hypothetical protein
MRGGGGVVRARGGRGPKREPADPDPPPPPPPPDDDPDAAPPPDPDGVNRDSPPSSVGRFMGRMPSPE